MAVAADFVGAIGSLAAMACPVNPQAGLLLNPFGTALRGSRPFAWAQGQAIFGKQDLGLLFLNGAALGSSFCKSWVGSSEVSDGLLDPSRCSWSSGRSRRCCLSFGAGFRGLSDSTRNWSDIVEFPLCSECMLT